MRLRLKAGRQNPYDFDEVGEVKWWSVKGVAWKIDRVVASTSDRYLRGPMIDRRTEPRWRSWPRKLVESFERNFEGGDTQSRLVSKLRATPRFSDSIRLKRSRRWRASLLRASSLSVWCKMGLLRERPGFHHDVPTSKAVYVSVHKLFTSSLVYR